VKATQYCLWGKRALDLVVSSAALLLMAPLIAGIVLLSRMLLGEPALLRQWRPGLQGRPFKLFKIRTMNEARDDGGHLRPDAERLTPFGRFLRRTSIDELPELWNVLRGEMSLVGPRPLLMQYLERYTSEQARRHEVRPGITGWAQVNGRNALSWEDRFAMDVWYVDHRSLWLDLKILILTAWKVVRREGIEQPGHATMREFTGPGS
jgi:sugar transferase EpsL